MDLKKYIRSIPDYPKKGILFRDITTLIKNPEAFKFANDKIIEIAKKIDFDKVSAIESRGFVFASTVSYILNKPFIAIPLPTAKDNHQMKNAQFYEEMGCCWVLDQRNLEKEKLLNVTLNILKDKSDLIDKKSNLEKLNFENSWNDVNQKLQKIINEN